MRVTGWVHSERTARRHRRRLPLLRLWPLHSDIPQWVSVSEEDIVRMAEVWETPGRESLPPVPGTLANSIPVFEEPTLGLRVLVHTQPLGLRPHVELVEDGHRLAVEQREGITHDAFVHRVGQLLHAA
jgi:hypothetical protein